MKARLSEIGLTVSAWYRAGHRALPWRETDDPYKILVSEIMLQQTRVETVIGYWKRFLEVFPDIASLAGADTEQVMNMWQGLGYYARARNLQKAAQMVVREYHGRFPELPADIRRLPGIGAYTTGALASIAFGLPVPAVDGNVLRVTSRLLLLEGDVGTPGVKRGVEAFVADMIPTGRASDFCQGMMELGATICTPTSPVCSSCPADKLCLARKTGRQLEFPHKQAKSPPVESRQIVCLIRDESGRILLQNRKEGLLSGLWGIPHFESDNDEPDADALMERLGLTGLDAPEAACDRIHPLFAEGFVGTVTHVFTHRKWNMEIWSFLWRDLSDGPGPAEDFTWFAPDRLSGIPIPEAFRKVLRLAGKQPPEEKRKNT